MENKVKVCEKCKTINDQNANFCRVCGADLGDAMDTNPNKAPENFQQEQSQQNSEETYVPNMNYTGTANSTSNNDSNYAPNSNYNFNPNYNPNEIYGIPVNEVALFVGEKANSYIPKFIKKSANFKKAGFNWAVFLLGFLLSPVIASFWFFHRRLNKIGAIVFAIGMIIFVAQIAMSANVVSNISEFSDIPFVQTYDGSSYTYDKSYTYNSDIDWNSLTNEQEAAIKQLVLFFITTLLLSLLSLATIIISAIYADYWYLLSIINKIKKVKAKKPDYTQDDIIYAGGTKAATWASLLVVYVFVSVVSTVYISSIIIDQFSNMPLN